MTRSIPVVLALLALVACGKGAGDKTAAADSLNRDLQLAPAESTMALSDTECPTRRSPPRPRCPSPGSCQAQAETGGPRGSCNHLRYHPGGYGGSSRFQRLLALPA
jgi:hypothetical protein